MLSRAVALLVVASGAQAFIPAAPCSVHVAEQRAPAQRWGGLRGGLACVSMQAESPVVSRRIIVNGALASAVLVGSGSPAMAELFELKAACTTQSCPDAPDSDYKVDTLAVNKGKFTGQGYQFERPTDEYFKRVQVFDRVTARPGSVLLRDKKNPDIAIFSNVEQIKNSDYTWKPTIVEVMFKMHAQCMFSLHADKYRSHACMHACTCVCARALTHALPVTCC